MAAFFRFRSLALAVVSFAMCLSGPGCSSPPPAAVPMNPSFSNLRIIRTAYVRASQQLDRPPENLQELMPYLKEAGDPATILRSPDDGQDYKIVYGVDILHGEPGHWPVIAYEQRGGADGKRFVLQGREPQRLTEEEFKKASLPPG